MAAAARLSRLAAARPERGMHDRGATNRLAFNDRGAPTSGPAKRCGTSVQGPQMLAGA